MSMPLESHQRISIRTKRQKSSAEKEKAEAQLKRIRDMIDKENRKDRHKTAQETRGNLKEFLRQMKPKDAPNKEES
jgi:beta-xylosidase